LTCPKWHFGQVGHGSKKIMAGGGDQNSNKKNHDFFVVNYNGTIFYDAPIVPFETICETIAIS